MDSTNPYTRPSNFTDLLNSQQDSGLPVPSSYESFSHGGVLSSQIPMFSSQPSETASFCEDSPTEKKERKKWSVSDDLVLISAWLNTSNDPVVSNEKRIANYFAASPQVARGEEREPIQCKQRWQKVNDLVCKFCGAYAAATRQKTSGQSESDVVKLAHQIFYNDHKMKFNLHHAWEELKMTRNGGKRRRCEDGAQSACSEATTNRADHPTARPPGVKASKGACGKRPMVDQQGVTQFQNMVSIKEKDMAIKEKDMALKERLSKMGLLGNLISKTEPLSEYEEALKQKLITEMLGD
uniref:Myb-like domain-containing protein n=1 Tax=Brassica oleracea var. oleracea TaxID=109376 RepID=A0A0D3D5Z8_BRAOL